VVVRLAILRRQVKIVFKVQLMLVAVKDLQMVVAERLLYWAVFKVYLKQQDPQL